MGSQFKLNVLISFDSSVVWGSLSCTIKITCREGGWWWWSWWGGVGIGGIWKPAAPLLHHYLYFVINSPELCGDLRGVVWSICMQKLEGQPQCCKMNVLQTYRLCHFIDFTPQNKYTSKTKRSSSELLWKMNLDISLLCTPSTGLSPVQQRFNHFVVSALL